MKATIKSATLLTYLLYKQEVFILILRNLLINPLRVKHKIYYCGVALPLRTLKLKIIAYAAALKLNPWDVTGFTDGEKSLVVFGSNLSSTVRIKFNRTQLAMVKLAPYQHSVIIGLLLSDGWLSFASKTTKNARLGFVQSLAKASYVFSVFNILSRLRTPSGLVVMAFI